MAVTWRRGAAVVALALGALGFGLVAVRPGTAQPGLPERGIIEMTVLFPAGSSADVTARLLADGMSRRLGNKVIVVNRPGAGGAIGYRWVAAQKADGSAIVWNSNSISTAHHSGALAVDYTAFEPVARVLVETPVLAVRADAPWKTLPEFVAAMKARPGQITIGHSGVGSHTHMSLVALLRAGGVEAVEVPFGAAQVVPSLLGAQVDAVLQLPGALTSYVTGGQLRLLAALTAARDPNFPDVPTAREQGFDLNLEAWRGIAVPKGTSPVTINALEAAIKATVASPDFIEASVRLGVKPAFLPAAEFARVIAKEDDEVRAFMAQVGLLKQAEQGIR
ncbi:tripartite tricarboxylate transporter substrate binding protein [Rhodoplanes sp.]|uniref:tripartite tricarboxylate transporter substrate binding protein n=1 Tax=Rhodoplanes sp. TaxID=1968906 RepID=UPI0025EA678E|nr:tripartite tricarboxylate transporter substrate binding protein [Rhodoplanes sp.]